MRPITVRPGFYYFCILVLPRWLAPTAAGENVRHLQQQPHVIKIPFAENRAKNPQDHEFVAKILQEARDFSEKSFGKNVPARGRTLGTTRVFPPSEGKSRENHIITSTQGSLMHKNYQDSNAPLAAELVTPIMSLATAQQKNMAVAGDIIGVTSSAAATALSPNSYYLSPSSTSEDETILTISEDKIDQTFGRSVLPAPALEEFEHGNRPVFRNSDDRRLEEGKSTLSGENSPRGKKTLSEKKLGRPKITKSRSLSERSRKTFEAVSEEEKIHHRDEAVAPKRSLLATYKLNTEVQDEIAKSYIDWPPPYAEAYLDGKSEECVEKMKSEWEAATTAGYTSVEAWKNFTRSISARVGGLNATEIGLNATINTPTDSEDSVEKLCKETPNSDSWWHYQETIPERNPNFQTCFEGDYWTDRQREWWIC